MPSAFVALYVLFDSAAARQSASDSIRVFKVQCFILSPPRKCMKAIILPFSEHVRLGMFECDSRYLFVSSSQGVVAQYIISMNIGMDIIIIIPLLLLRKLGDIFLIFNPIIFLI